MVKAGCLFFLAIIGLLSVELYVVLVLIQHLQDVPMPIAGVVALSIVGYKLMLFHKARLMTAFMHNNAGKRIMGMLGAILLIIPGFITGAIGLFLQIPFIQSVFGKLGNALMASVMRRAMGGGFGKGFPGAGFPPGGMPGGFPGGFPGGAFPGGPAGLFPGGFPKADESLNIGKGGKGSKGTPKTYDVKPDKD